jgi:hypothetical protein
VANDDAECSRPEQVNLLSLMFPTAAVSKETPASRHSIRFCRRMVYRESR